jgi:hypothetical protein
MRHPKRRRIRYRGFEALAVGFRGIPRKTRLFVGWVADEPSDPACTNT